MSAQSFTGRMLGSVTDPSGAAIAGASVRIVNVGTNKEWSTITDEEGRFASPELPRGEYSLEVSAPGFKKFTRSGLSLQIQQQARIDVRLEVGQTTESIEIVADATLLETSDATLRKVVDNKRIMELPLNTRNVFSLIYLTPGVSGCISTDYGTGYSSTASRPACSK